MGCSVGPWAMENELEFVWVDNVTERRVGMLDVEVVEIVFGDRAVIPRMYSVAVTIRILAVYVSWLRRVINNWMPVVYVPVIIQRVAWTCDPVLVCKLQRFYLRPSS